MSLSFFNLLIRLDIKIIEISDIILIKILKSNPGIIGLLLILNPIITALMIMKDKIEYLFSNFLT